MQETGLRSLGQEDPLGQEMATHSEFLPGKSHGQRSLEGYSPWGHKRVGHDLVTKQQQPGQIQSKRHWSKKKTSDFSVLRAA